MSEEESKLAVDEAEKAVEQWKVKKLISTLEAARGNGTSMISLIIPPKDQISRVTKMLGDELGTATHIKSRVNRLSVLGAITSVQQKLKLYNRVPPNGLVVYSGSVITLEGKEKKINIDFEPFKPINTSLYLCVDGEAIVCTSSGVGRRIRDIVKSGEGVAVYGLSQNSARDMHGPLKATDVTLETAAVTHVATRGRRPCVGVHLSDGRELVCTHEHRILIVREGTVQWAHAHSIMRGDHAMCAPDTHLKGTMSSSEPPLHHRNINDTGFIDERDNNDDDVVGAPSLSILSVVQQVVDVSQSTFGPPLCAVSVRVLSVCDVGERDVFDLSVSGLSSFTANGVIVHNCDNKFHTEALNELLESDEKFGFIVMDGMGTLFGVLSGNTRTILHKFTVDLPKKHGRGGQSALRFARLRLEKRHNYLRKVAETAVQMFITNDRPNVSGLILAGSAEFKTKLNASDLFDPRLQTIVQKIVDVSYGGENGFNQAIELAADCLLNVKFIREKKLLSNYFSEIAKDSGRYCFNQADSRVLTNKGFLFLEQIEAELATGNKLLYACYDTRSKAMHYRTGQVVFPPMTTARLLTFNSSDQAHRWTDHSGADDDDDAECAGLSMRVTSNHRMFVQSGIARSDERTITWRTAANSARLEPPTVVPAAALLSPCNCSAPNINCAHRRAAVRMLSCAESGYTPSTDAAADIIRRLRIVKRSVDDFLELFGYWCARGSLQYDGAVMFAHETSERHDWICEKLYKIGVSVDIDSDKSAVGVRNEYWITFFHDEFGTSNSSSSPKLFPDWDVWQLAPNHLARIVEGVRCALGTITDKTTSVVTSNVAFRDQLMHVLMHSAFTPLSQRVRTPQDENACTHSSASATAAVWRVSWSAARSRYARPSLVCADGIVESEYDAAIDGRLWCVQVDHADHLIIAQRAQRSGDNVTMMSRPVIIGNCFGVKDTLAALDLGAVEELIVWESLDINRLVLKNKELSTERVVYWTERQEKEPTALKESDGTELEVVDKVTLLEWLANNFKSFGAKLQFVTNKSQEGSQFVKGFGGIGGLLRYQVDFLTMEVVEEDEDDFM